MLSPVHAVLSRTGLDAIVLVPGANFRRVFAKDFHQMERPPVSYTHLTLPTILLV